MSTVASVLLRTNNELQRIGDSGCLALDQKLETALQDLSAFAARARPERRHEESASLIEPDGIWSPGCDDAFIASKSDSSKAEPAVSLADCSARKGSGSPHSLDLSGEDEGGELQADSPRDKAQSERVGSPRCTPRA